MAILPYTSGQYLPGPRRICRPSMSQQVIHPKRINLIQLAAHASLTPRIQCRRVKFCLK